MIIAGGGGGTDNVHSRHPGCNASTGASGNSGHGSWARESNGNGGKNTDGSNTG